MSTTKQVPREPTDYYECDCPVLDGVMGDHWPSCGTRVRRPAPAPDDKPEQDAISRLMLSRHPVLRSISDVCQAIEACGASVELTHAVTLAGQLSEPVAQLLDLIERQARELAELQSAVKTVVQMADEVLLDPEGRVSIRGSDADCAIIQKAIDSAREKEKP